MNFNSGQLTATLPVEVGALYRKSVRHLLSQYTTLTYVEIKGLFSSVFRVHGTVENLSEFRRDLDTLVGR